MTEKPAESPAEKALRRIDEDNKRKESERIAREADESFRRNHKE